MPKKTKSLNKGTCSFYTKKIFDGIDYAAPYSCILKFIPPFLLVVFLRCHIILFCLPVTASEILSITITTQFKTPRFRNVFFKYPRFIMKSKRYVYAKIHVRLLREVDDFQSNRPRSNRPQVKTKVESATYFKLKKKKLCSDMN